MYNLSMPVRLAAWYAKAFPTFSDVSALVRKEIWRVRTSSASQKSPDLQEIPASILQTMVEALAYAA